MSDTEIAAVLAGTFALLGVIITSLISLMVTWVNDRRERNKTLFQWAEERKLRDEEKRFRDSDRITDYVLKRLSMVYNLSKPLGHRQVMKDYFISEHIRLVGESVFSKQTFLIWNHPELARVVEGIEELFYETWEKRMTSENNQDFEGSTRKIEELSVVLFEGLGQISGKKHYLVAK
jgi:hypothetical protein